MPIWRPHRRAHDRRLQRLGQEPGGQQPRRADPAGARTGPHGIGVAVCLVRPGGNPAVAVEARAQIHRRAGPVGLPGVLLLARPFEQHRRAGQSAGDKGRVEGRIVGARYGRSSRRPARGGHGSLRAPGQAHRPMRGAGDRPPGCGSRRSGGRRRTSPSPPKDPARRASGRGRS